MQIDKSLGMALNHKHKVKDLSDYSAGAVAIPELNSDPVSPTVEQAWVLKFTPPPDGIAGTPRGLLLALTYAGATAPSTYQFSYNSSGGIMRVPLS